MSGQRRITVMRGLPASGKSRCAREIQTRVRATGGLCAIVSRDVLRDMLGVGWSGGPRAEAAVTAMQHAMVRAAFAAGAVEVVVDDTNLHPASIPGWQKLAAEVGAEFQVIDIDVHVDICVVRDSRRPEVGPDGLIYGRQVGEEVIRRLADGRMTDLQAAMHTG